MSRCLDCSSKQDDYATNEDTDSSPITIGKKTAKWKGCNLAKIIDDEDDARTRSCPAEAKGLLIWSHRVDTTHERGV